MKETLRLSLAAAVALMSAGNLSATIYTDSVGDVFTGAGGGILDITSVEVNNTATDLIFKINLAGDPVTTDWGKYLIAIDSVPGGDSAGNGWGRPISMAGMDYWVGSWVDSGNAMQVFNYGAGWTQIGGVGTFAGGPAVPGLAITKDASSLTITTPLSLLGLGIGDTLLFDVYTSGGGNDGAIDALANPLQTIGDWGDPYTSANPLSYTIPEPTSLALLGLAGGVMLMRLARRR